MIKKYYRITAKTPYCGETQDYYIITEDYHKVLEFASDCVDDNANEWYDDEAAEEYDWDDYLADCYCDIEEITYEEYRDECGY